MQSERQTGQDSKAPRCRLPARRPPPGRMLGLVVGLGMLWGGCGKSQQTGALNKAVFVTSECGGVLSGVAGCELSRGIAVGGLVDVRAVLMGSSAPLSVQTDVPSVLEVKQLQGAMGPQTLIGNGVGTATLLAVDTSGATVDRLEVKVKEIASLSYVTVNTSTGTFRFQPSGDVNGTFELAATTKNFTLLFAQVSQDGQQPLGRETFTTELSPQLAYQAGKENPKILQFELVRPAQTGAYPLTITAKQGPGRFKMQIDVK